MSLANDVIALAEGIEFDVLSKNRKQLSTGDTVTWKGSKWKVLDVTADEKVELEPTEPSKQGKSVETVPASEVTK